MKTVNYGDKYEKRLTLRLTNEQYDYLVNVSNVLGVSPSEYLRMGINASIFTTGKEVEDMINGVFKVNKGGTSNENVKTNINNQL